MAQHQQQLQSVRGDAWLSALVDTFEQIDRLEPTRCDEDLRSAIEARLSRPASSRLPMRPLLHPLRQFAYC